MVANNQPDTAGYDESMSKTRITISVDGDLVADAERAVNEGAASSISAWFNAAAKSASERDRRSRAMAEAIASYEAEFGAFTQEELDAAGTELGIARHSDPESTA
jgi:metal-responsive CopG/Arc/MetJ family transcriptional regulator